MNEALTVWTAYEKARSGGRQGHLHFTKQRRALIKRRLEDGFSVEELCAAVQGWKHSPWHCGHNPGNKMYHSIELILRDANHIETFRDLHDDHFETQTYTPPTCDVCAVVVPLNNVLGLSQRCSADECPYKE